MQDAPVAPFANLSVSLADLWLPILLATVAVFFLSFLAWAILPHHKPEYGALPDEAGFGDAVRRLNIPAGGYFFPYCTGADMKTEEGKRRYEQGPWGRLRLYPGKPGMGGSMLGSVLLYLAASCAIAYVGALTIPAGADFGRVLQVLGVVAVLAYTVAVMPQIIWFERSWRAFVTHLLDGVVYGLATALLFAWLWPALGAGAVAGS